MDHSQMIHGGQPGMMMQGMLPQETGQSAFAAIQEIVAILSANPATDWSKIDIEALVRTRPSSGPFHTHSTARAISVEVSP
ncbi:MAG: hypothetical protein Q8L53_00255 [Aestuariivirga sp.]|nr:hypothetical protein [Aestuariivirga sp.]